MFYIIFIICCTYLTLFCRHLSSLNSLGAFGHEQNSEGGEDDFQVFDDAGVGDVHQIHLQLVVGAGVVFAVDLGVAGEAGLGLEAQAEFRNLALVLARDFRTLGARADDAHAALQNVEQLGHLVQAAGADEAAHRRDAVVVLSAGKARRAVLSRVASHAAELPEFHTE